MARLSRYVAFGDQAVSSISNFVAVAITANVATPGEFGEFSLGYAGLLLFLGAQRALIGETLLVKYSAAGALEASVRRGVLGATVLVAAATFPLLLAGVVLADQSARLIWLVMAASLPFVLLQDTLRYLFICEDRPWRALLIDAVWAVLSIASMAAVASTTGAVWAVVLCWGGGAAAALVLGLLLGRALPSLRDGRRWLGVTRAPGLRYLGEFSALNASNFVVLYLLVLPGRRWRGCAAGSAIAVLTPQHRLFRYQDGCHSRARACQRPSGLSNAADRNGCGRSSHGRPVGCGCHAAAGLCGRPRARRILGVRIRTPTSLLGARRGDGSRHCPTGLLQVRPGEQIVDSYASSSGPFDACAATGTGVFGRHPWCRLGICPGSRGRGCRWGDRHCSVEIPFPSRTESSSSADPAEAEFRPAADAR